MVYSLKEARQEAKLKGVILKTLPKGGYFRYLLTHNKRAIGCENLEKVTIALMRIK